MPRYPIKLLKAHSTDPKQSSIRSALHTTVCLHCSKKFSLHETIMYTKLSNGKLIWWCVPPCTPDPIEEIE